MTATREEIKEIYKVSNEKIKNCSRIVSGIDKKQSPTLPPQDDLDSLQNLVNGIEGSHRFEDNNDYKDVITDTCLWILACLKDDYLNENNDSNPSSGYVLKKGVELLHMLLLRDLRRRQLTPTENQKYYNFHELTTKLPDPPMPSHLSQDDVDQYLK